MQELLSLEELKNSYYNLLKVLFTWIDNTITKLEQPIRKDIADELKEFKSFRKTEKPSK